ncbi:hypothetical protein [Hymenobacter lapidiphilus]|uniref:Glycosyltransferase RgtA/B/C/D-like domain-containing protein n=1 Tax=Hymenobacter lapidiphilus TaxID=2608003 RepID=A0A7Y7PRE0_9BACT|nr:hypothetical protein [Hymenobacter lapidiphilus]NVO32646.1 hypothetical protein [Hymenobacter lapidiphilus]
MIFGYHGPGVGGDADVYWGLASRFRKDGNLSLLNFDSSLRGYLFPLLLMPIKAIVYFDFASQSFMTILFNSIIAAILFGFVVPKLYLIIRPSCIITPIKLILFTGLSLFFWIGYFNYTLTDFPAMLFLGLSLLMLLNNNNNKIIFILIAGILFGAAVNFRPVYIISVPFFIIISQYSIKGELKFFRKILNFVIIIVGIGLPMLPQLYINNKVFKENTPLVLTKNQTDRGTDLLLAQLGWALQMQKFETAFGSAPGGRNAVVFYRNPAGNRLLNDNGYKSSKLWGVVFTSKTQYLELVANNPIEMVGIYLRQAFNGFDQHHNTPYIRRPIQDFTLLLPVVNYTIWFGVLLLAWPMLRNVKSIPIVNILAILILISPCIVASLMAMETRFFIPIHLIMYALLSFEWKSIMLNKWLNKDIYVKIFVVCCYICFVILCLRFSWLIHEQQYIWSPN